MNIVNFLSPSIKGWGKGAGLLIAALLFVFTATAAAETKQYTIDDVPNVRLSDVRQYVTDPSAILSATARDSINAILGRLEKSTGIETAVVMLPSIGDENIFDFGHELFRKWGIGKKKSDNGLLILFVKDQKKVRFTTGYGIEGTMTDAMSKRIQTTIMIPRFRNGNWDGGMVSGVRAVAKTLDGSMQAEEDNGEDDISTIMITLLAIVVTMLIFIYAMGSLQRCPKCKKRSALRKVKEQHLVVKNKNGRIIRRILRTTYVCKYCGNTVTKDTDENDHGSAMATGAMLGSMLGGGNRGSGFGGGSFGGSFGGGSTGGGGATSGW
ncbi:TPM domain-containing protein [uncultured Prevotella sp.]|uniref:TPM domain-containing protein n=1 Tax=uncultured Prevotella sp. TaxID=159272 RepID=UPI00261E79ED|nr:TPM domain-containing protein [uncultured Prevotella sp.]